MKHNIAFKFLIYPSQCPNNALLFESVKIAVVHTIMCRFADWIMNACAQITLTSCSKQQMWTSSTVYHIYSTFMFYI